jgi:hypothetical protein
MTYGVLSLTDLQTLLSRLITAPNGVQEGLAKETTLATGGLATVVVGDQQLSPFERVSIYATAYFYRLLDVFKEDYPATLAVLNDHVFHNLVTGYLISCPPTEPSIFYASRFFPDYLRAHPVRESCPFLADLAALERSIIDVFVMHDAPALGASDMRSIAPGDWPQMVLRTVPAVRILDLEWRVDALLRAVEEGQEWQEPVRDGASVMVWRQGPRVTYRGLERAECRALKLALEGTTLTEICDRISADIGESQDRAVTIAQLLARWISEGLLVIGNAPNGKVTGSCGILRYK